MSKLPRLALAAALAAGLIVPGLAGATDIEHKRQEAARVAAELERLQGEAFSLGGEFDEVEQRLTKVTAEATAAQNRLTELETDMASLRASAKQLAIHAYVSGTQQSGLAFLVGGDGPADAVPRSQYMSVALGAQAGALDQLSAVSDDVTEQRDLLQGRLAEQQRLQQSLQNRQEQVNAALTKFKTLQTQVKGELAQLVAAEQARRVQAAQRAARSAAPAAPTASRAASQPRSAQAPQAPKQAAGPRAGASVPAPSPGAGGAVAAALSQVGVPYRFAAASPGEAFDCSGLTLWAWGQAGVGLPHQSRAQAAMLPQVSQDQAQPGDLIFYYAPIGHVGMYIGGGQLVHATRPGDVVKVATVRWDRVAAIGRPG